MNLIYEYELNLITYQHRYKRKRNISPKIRLVTLKDKPALVNLMLSAFLEPQFHNQDNRNSASLDIENFFAGKKHSPLLNCSFGYWQEQILIGACLISYWKERESALIDCIMVKNNYKSKNISYAIFQISMEHLILEGYNQVRATISQENLLPQKLAQRLGFRQLKEA